MRRPADLALTLWLALAACATPAGAEGRHTELGMALSGAVNLGDLGTLSRFGYGFDAALGMVPDREGLGLRVAAGAQALQGHSIPTGANLRQSAVLDASQSYTWIGVGPSWSKPLGSRRADLYLLAGAAHASATSVLWGYVMVGDDPGSTIVPLLVLGAAWSPRGNGFEFGTQLMLGGKAALWNDPPVFVDVHGHDKLSGAEAAITALALRVGYRFGGLDEESEP